MPDLAYELSYAPQRVCGIDEAGRGPLAGPVFAAAVILPLAISLPQTLNDSKKISPKTRLALCEWITAHATIGIGQSSVEEIDTMNILRATHLAMQRAFSQLPQPPEVALIDGNSAPTLACQTRTIVGGDGISASIAAASIIAKVTRDRLMLELDSVYPQYGFAAHQGYGTKAHLNALSTYGPSPAHRQSFAPVKTRALLPAA